MNPFESHLQTIGNAITIKDEDRPIFTKDFAIIRDYMFDLMRRDPAFRSIFKGPSLFGSYSNNVRINKPDEFDVLMKLSFPYSTYIEIKEDSKCPGFVNLNFNNVMLKLDDNTSNKAVYMLLKNNLVDWNNGYLRRSNLRYWITKIITAGLNEMGDLVAGCHDTYKLKYSMRGLAHTVFAYCSARKISIDFIPSIVFSEAEWIKVRNVHPFRGYFNSWYAVPKPIRSSKKKRVYRFLICNPELEHNLLLHKQNLKVVFRLLKSLRNQYEIRRLKSYFLTTAFLWEIEKLDDSFWENKLYVILEHMLDKLCDYFLDGKLPFFWDPEMNLLDNLKQEEIKYYSDQLCKAYNTLITYKHQVNILFSTCLRHFQVPCKNF